MLHQSLFGIEVIDPPAFAELIIRFSFNLIVILVIVRLLYFRSTRRKDYLFSYLIISTVVFLLCFLLNSVKLQIGFALGLFAVFGIIRYRTTTVPIKEMTFLFVVIGISVINALANDMISYAEIVFSNLVIIFITWGMVRVWLLNDEGKKLINYEKIDLIKPGREGELLADLKERTGLDIIRYEIGRIDFLRDTVRIRVYFRNPDHVNMDDDDPESITGAGGER